MELQTKINLKSESNNLIDYNSKLFLIGSCFVENIGEKLSYFKFQSVINPFGILFHPLAIETLITKAINVEFYSEEDLFFYNERWHCFDAHSSLSSTNKDDLLEQLNNAIKQANDQLKNATQVVITLGTSWVYRFVENDNVVASCHKVPQKKFIKELLSIDELVNSLQAIIALIRTVNTNTSIIFTVSPVRHIKDGIIENSRSKAHLLAAIHSIVEPRYHLHYFPSYEIMMDELRDYRFYAEDMIHPNDTAVNYIWEKFQHVWISENANETMQKVEEIQKGLNHKPFNENSDQYLQFRNRLIEKQTLLQKEFPYITF